MWLDACGSTVESWWCKAGVGIAFSGNLGFPNIAGLDGADLGCFEVRKSWRCQLLRAQNCREHRALSHPVGVNMSCF